MNISRELQKHIDNPLKLRGLHTDLSENSFQWNELLFSFETEGHNFKNIMFHGAVLGTELGLLDALCCFFEGRDIRFLNSIVPADFENFLRDENHIPAFSEDLVDLDKVFSLRLAFLKAINIKNSPIVCSCYKINYKQIEDFLKDNPDIEALSRELKVGQSCSSCLSPQKANRDYYVSDIYNSISAKIRSGYFESDSYKQLDSKGLSSLGHEEVQVLDEDLKPFSELGIVEKLQAVQKVFDHKVRPFLQQDGGDLELIDIDEHDIFISYTGACGSCGSSTQGTLQFIIKTLIDQFQEPKLNVIIDQ